GVFTFRRRFPACYSAVVICSPSEYGVGEAAWAAAAVLTPGCGRIDGSGKQHTLDLARACGVARDQPDRLADADRNRAGDRHTLSDGAAHRAGAGRGRGDRARTRPQTLSADGADPGPVL